MDFWEEDETVSKPEAVTGPWDNDEIISKTPTVREYAAGLSGGIGRGLTSTLGAPVDITHAILEGIGIKQTKEPFGGSASIKKGFESIGFQYPEAPPTPLGRTIARVGEEAGAMVLPAAGMYKAALRVAEPVSTVAKAFLDPIRRNALKSAGYDIASTIGAGTGAGIAKEIAPESKGAETTGQVVGGFAPAVAAYTPLAMVTKAVRAVTSRFSSKAQLDAAKKAVESVMGGSLNREATEMISGAADLTARTGGKFQPSVAESTQVPSLIAIQNQIEKEASGKFLNSVSQRRKDNLKAIKQFTEQSAPQGDISPEIVIDSATKRIQLVGEKVDKLTARVVQTRKDLANGLPTIEKMGTGQTLRESIVKAKQEVSAKMSLLANKLGVDEIDMTQQYGLWKKDIAKKYELKSRFEDKASMPESLRLINNDKATATSFNDIKALRERVSDDIIDELSSSNPSRRKVRTLSQLKKDVDDLLASAEGGAGDSLAKFRKQYFEEYITPFESGAMFKVKNKDGTGFFRTRDEQVADLFLDNPSAARQFRGIFGDDAVAMKNLEGSFLDKMRSTIAQDGIIDEKKLIGFVKKNQDILNELPSLNKAVIGIDAANNSLIKRQTQLAIRQNNIQQNALAKELSRYSQGNIDAEKVLSDSLKDPRKMRSLKMFIKKDEDALNALRRTVWDKASKGNSAEVLKFLASHEESMKVLFSPQHFNDIQDISAMRSMMEIMPKQPGVASIPSPLEHIEKMVGMGIPQASTRWYAFMSGRLAKSYLLADMSRAIIYSKGKANMESLLRDAIYDPAVAREMATAVRTGALSVDKAMGISSRIFALGIPYLRNKEPNNGDMPTTPSGK